MFEKIFKVFMKNISIALAFGLLLVFIFFFTFFNVFDFTSGTIFYQYYFSSDFIPFEIALFIIYLFFYSFFVSLMIFAVRRDLSNVRVEYYLKEVITKLASKIFVFNLILSLALIISGATLIYIADIDSLIVGFAFLLISLSFSFVPQAIVVDEKGIIHSIEENFDFIKKNPKILAGITVLASILCAVIVLIEFLIDILTPSFYLGRFVSLVLALIFVIPFIETAKTFVYMLKFDLIRNQELLIK